MANLAAYIIRRLILLVFVILGVSVLVFAVSMLFTPSQRAMLYIRNSQRISNAGIQEVIRTYGLEDPFYLQYGRWISQVVQGNLGWSVTATQTVTDAIKSRWPFTFEIVMFAAPLIIFIGIYLGVQSAVHRDTPVDQASRIFSVIGWSLPSFWVGMVLLAVFYGILGWFGPDRSVRNFRSP